MERQTLNAENPLAHLANLHPASLHQGFAFGANGAAHGQLPFESQLRLAVIAGFTRWRRCGGQGLAVVVDLRHADVLRLADG